MIPPNASMWMCDLVLYLKLEKNNHLYLKLEQIKYLTKGSVEKSVETWQPMITYVENMKPLPLNWSL